MDTTNHSTIAVTGEDLSIQKFIEVARYSALATYASIVNERASASREALDRMLDNNDVIYGINTGFGGNVKFLIPPAEVAVHQRGMLRHLYCGTGGPLSPEIVRGAILLRANALAKGYSGVRTTLLDRLIELLNADIVPVVPMYGSVGASGDLIPSAYIASALIGEGTVFYRGEEMPAAAALTQAEIPPIDLKPKEGLALINGTTVMTSVAGLAVFDTSYLAPLCVAAVAMSLEVLKGTLGPFDENIHRTKNHPGQAEVAALIQRFTKGSSLTANLETMRQDIRQEHACQTNIEEVHPIQMPYSIRCAPQGLGPAFEALEFSRTVIEREMNSVNDNPLIDGCLNRVYHTGNFYGGHIARVMDGMKIDLANIANWAHALLAMLVDPRFSNGLPPNLVEAPGLHSGFKGMQLSQTSLVVDCRQMASPSSIHTLPTEQYNQDIVSLGLHSSLTAWEMTQLARDALAILLLALCQGLDLRKRVEPGVKFGEVTHAIHSMVRDEVKFLEVDRPMHADIEYVSAIIRQQGFELT